MIINVDQEGKNLINSVIQCGMKAGAFGIADVQGLAILLGNLKLLEEELKKH